MINILKNFYWFNPTINFLTRRLRKDIEISTDKLVIEHVEIKKYLILILKISQFEASNGVAFPSFAADKKILERRIKIVKKERKLSLKVISLFAALIGALSVTGVALASPPKTTENSQQSSQESQSQPSSSNLGNNSISGSNTNNNSSNAPENKNKNKNSDISDIKGNSPSKDNPSKTDVKELKWDESRHCYVSK